MSRSMTMTPGNDKNKTLRSYRVTHMWVAVLLGVLAICAPLAAEDPEGKTYEVTCSRVTVGSEEGEIVLGDPLVSRKHAAFEIYGSHHIVVKDLASTNGTYLNGRLIAYSKLNNGDKIKVGTTVLEALIEVGG